MVKSEKSLVSLVNASRRQTTHRCANQAFVIMESFSRSCPKWCGLSDMTTTAFCTVERVTSAGLLTRVEASICLVQAIPNNDVAGRAAEASFRRVKYENSSIELPGNQPRAGRNPDSDSRMRAV
jgi:hypothetical protein